MTVAERVSVSVVVDRSVIVEGIPVIVVVDTPVVVEGVSVSVVVDRSVVVEGVSVSVVVDKSVVVEGVSVSVVVGRSVAVVEDCSVELAVIGGPIVLVELLEVPHSTLSRVYISSDKRSQKFDESEFISCMNPGNCPM